MHIQLGIYIYMYVFITNISISCAKPNARGSLPIFITSSYRNTVLQMLFDDPQEFLLGLAIRPSHEIPLFDRLWGYQKIPISYHPNVLFSAYCPNFMSALPSLTYQGACDPMAAPPHVQAWGQRASMEGWVNLLFQPLSKNYDVSQSAICHVTCMLTMRYANS